MRPRNALSTVVFIVIAVAGLGFDYLFFGPAGWQGPAFIFVVMLVAALVASALKVADQWNRAVVLRLGRFRALKGPGLFVIIPIIDTIPYWIDIRVITSSFSAERTLTKDTVPVNVDAVLFWKVVDPKKAALDVADYQSAINWAAQTALRDVIGKTILSDMLEGREKISAELQKIIDKRTEPWGINVISVEVKDVLIPSALEDAMSMQAQAERERQARVILGDFERQIAEKFVEAADDLRQQSDRLAFARDEHALRGAQAEFHHRHRAEYGGRQYAARRPCRTDGLDDGLAGEAEVGAAGASPTAPDEPPA